MSVSLIVATYNSPDYLSLCLRSIANQRHMPDEIIIADDGSTNQTLEVIEQFKKLLKVPVIHVWHEDTGFRLAEIRNKAIARAQGSYIIQIDGDVILNPHFVADHLAFAGKEVLLQGSRAMLQPEVSRELVTGKIHSVGLFSGGLKRRENAFHFPLLGRFLADRYRNPYPVYYARGCNMSFNRADFIRVNGYDETFIGWGHEDSDLTLRMMNAGIRKKYLKFTAIVYHLYHSEEKRIQDSPNLKMMEEHLRNHTIRCEKGISQYL